MKVNSEIEAIADAPSDASGALAVGRAVLSLEGAALGRFAEALDDSFVQAVERILALEGRVIVSGMGKSGHVGRKIAATLASTGTPAIFVHPAEASHGDLGMLTQHDLALVLSNSGETPELHNLILHCRRFEIPLIGVASRPESTLLKRSDVALVLPAEPEACALGLAPTTSTTLTMALGDALAVALMKRREFTPEGFRAFHPGGALGAQLLSVADLMHGASELPLVRPDTPMSEVIVEITRRSFGVAGVIDADGRLIGVISDGDLRRNIDRLMSVSARDVASSSPKVIDANALAAEAVALMNRKPSVTSLFVTEASDPSKPVGLIHIHDCLRAGVA